MCNARHDLTAIIYDKRGRVLSIGKNSYVKSHPMQARYAREQGEEHKIFLHAEMDAIIKCRQLDKAYKISIFRYNKKYEPVNARPCIICQSAIDKTSIKVIEHT